MKTKPAPLTGNKERLEFDWKHNKRIVLFREQDVTAAIQYLRTQIECACGHPDGTISGMQMSQLISKAFPALKEKEGKK